MKRKQIIAGALSGLTVVALVTASLIDVRHGFGYGGGGGGGSPQPSASVSLVTPDGGETWAAGTTHEIDWNYTGGSLISYVTIKYSTDGGNNYNNLIASKIPNNGSYPWLLPTSINSSTVKVRIEGYNTGDGMLGSDYSASNFTITQSTDMPDAPQNIMIGNPGTGDRLNISWTNPVVNFHHIKIYRSTVEGELGVAVHDNVVTTEKTDTGLTKDMIYYYTVKAVSATGVESDNTDQYSGKPTLSLVDVNKSYFNADKTQVKADGVEKVGFTVGARDKDNNPIIGMDVYLFSSRMDDSMSVISAENKMQATTDNNGEAKFVSSSNTVGISTFTAKIDGVILPDTISIEFTPTEDPSKNIADYAYEYVSRSSDPTINQGTKSTVSLTLKNTGRATWFSTGTYAVHLGTDRPQDRNCGFYTPGDWLTTNRIALDQGFVLPGQTGTFTFAITGAPGQGTYPEFFRPVVENVGWLNDQNIGWNISVRGVTYQYAWVSQSAYPTVAPGQTATLTLTIQNTGGADWDQFGPFPIHLGTDRPTDRSSDFYNNTWLSLNRPATLNEVYVAPGENATFTFTVQAPNRTGVFREYFRPVAENMSWMNDAGIYWDINVQ